MTVAEHLSIGEVADRTGVSVSALRFYEAEGCHLEGTLNDLDFGGVAVPEIRYLVPRIAAPPDAVPRSDRA